MPKKHGSTDMCATVQRKYPRDLGHGESNAIPRSTEFDLHPAMSRTHAGYDECAFVQDKPGNALWDEKDRP
jgi:hypothetical protein